MTDFPSGNPKGILPQSPGLRRPRRYPGYGWEVLPNPEEGCADGSNGCPNRVWSHHDSGQPFWNRHFIPSKEPDPIPPLFLGLPAGTKPLKTGTRKKSHAKTPRREEETGFGCLASRRLCAISSVRCIWSFPPGCPGGKGRTANGRRWALMGERPCGRALPEFPRQRCRMG